MNSFGIRLLMPFSGRWFYGDALYIVDPGSTSSSACGALLAAPAPAPARRRRPGGAPGPGGGGTLYVAAMFVTGLWARQAVHAGLARAGRGDAVFMVTPVIANPLRARGDHRPRRSLREGLRGLHARRRTSARPATAWRSAPTTRWPARPAASRIGQQYLDWSRFPFFVVERTLTPPRVQLNDARYSGPMGTDGWSGTLVPVPEVPAHARRDRASQNGRHVQGDPARRGGGAGRRPDRCS